MLDRARREKARESDVLLEEQRKTWAGRNHILNSLGISSIALSLAMTTMLVQRLMFPALLSRVLKKTSCMSSMLVGLLARDQGPIVSDVKLKFEYW